MDNKIRTTLVAAAVSSVLTSTAFAASHSLPAKHALPSFDYNVQMAREAKNNAKAPNVRVANDFKKVENLNRGITRTAKSDHYDKVLDVHTFSWATSEQSKAAVPFNVLNRKAGIEQASLQFAQTVGAKHGVTTDAIAQAELKYIHDTGRGGLVSKYQQMVNGIEVEGRQFNVLMNQDMELVATTGYFSKAKMPLQPIGVQFKFAVTDAINVAIGDMGGDEVSMTKSADKGKYQNFKVQNGDSQLSVSDEVRAKKVYYPGKKDLVPAYYIEVIGATKGSTSSQGYRYVISAKNGTILSRHSMTFNEAFTYKVFADATAPYKPYDSPMGNELSPHPTGVATDVLTEVQQPMNDLTIENVGISTNDPWLPAGATETTGNNVDAYADITAPDGFNAPTTDDEGNAVPGDVRAQTTSAGAFDYQFTQTDAHDTPTNMNAAIVNLFYVNNYLHDVYYDHGFDEASGNAQMDNFGRGGLDGDPLHVQGQDSESTNNANMTIPNDGRSPRMQMYLWVEGNNLPLSIGTQTEVDFLNSSFSPGVYNLSGSLVRYEDGTDPANDACESATNADALAGNIVILDRGACDFSLKAGNAQAAGALGVLIANNDTDNPDQLVNMGAGDNPPNITIPVLSISYNTGVATYAEMANGPIEVSVASDQSVRDGTVDNPIIEHEWGHYFSGRLAVGMYGNSQGGSMGEGWGDFVALMHVVREEDQQIAGNEHFEALYNDGGYSLNNGGWTDPYYFGLRRAPYTTNMEFNALTFKHIQDQVALPDTHPLNSSDFGKSGGFNAEVHAAGEIWALALWESYVALLNRDGKSFDESEGQMMDYIVAGLKMTPANPTYTEARDAILAVVIANSMDDYTLMRAAFAKRGMGPGAVSPARNDAGFDGTDASQGHAGVVEDFTTQYSAVELTAADLDTAYVGLEGAFCDSDDILDVGETAALRFTVRNSGTTMQHGVKAMVSSTADVTFANGGVVEFENMHVWNASKSALVEMTLNSADVNSTIPIHITFSAEDSSARLPADIDATVTVNRDIAKDERRTMDDFETIPTVWADWSQHKIGPADSGNFVGLDDWTVLDVGFGTGNTMMGPDGRVQTDISLMSPMVKVGASGEFAMDFNHYYEYEVSPADGDTPAIYWDGSVLEISVDGGDWTDVIAAGGSFTENGGYNGTLVDSNPVLGGRTAFVDTISTLWITPERITFPEGTMNGHDVQFRFRIGTDQAAGGWGWNLDDVSFTNAENPAWSSIVADSGVCVNRPPAIGTQTQEVTEAAGGDQNVITLSVNVIDHDDPGKANILRQYDTYEEFAAVAAANNSAFTYNWTQTSGPDVTLDDSHSATPSFTAPVVGSDTDMTFSVEVSDGAAASTATVGVRITNVNSAPMVSGITGPEQVNENMEVTLIAMGEDPEGDALTYTWAQTGGTAATFASTTDHLTFNAPQVDDDEMLTFTAMTSDGEFTSEAASFSFTVLGNTAPTLSADSATYSVDEKKSVTLSVTGVDTDGDDLTYTWMVDGEAVNNSGNTYEFIAPRVTEDSTSAVSVTVSDGVFTSDAVNMTVNIKNTSSGAGMGLVTLLLAPLAFIRRRKQKLVK